MTEKSDVSFKIPQELIQAQVQAAVVSALAERGDEFVTEIVRHAMSAKDHKANSYQDQKRTIFANMVDRMIRQVAQDSVKEWLEEQKPLIRKQIRAALGARKKEQVASMADKILDALSTDMHVSISLKGDY